MPRWMNDVTLHASGLTEAERHELWGLLAEHFLDSETRQDIPHTALRCVELGCSPAEARDIWCYEVTPAVWANARSVAGEWAGWNHDWLVERIEHQRRRPPKRRAAWAYVSYRLRVGGLHGTWTAIERCMAMLAPLAPDRRTQVAADLGLLAGHYFCMAAGKQEALPSPRKAELRQLYDSTFVPMFVRDRSTGESPRTCAEWVACLLAA